MRGILLGLLIIIVAGLVFFIWPKQSAGPTRTEPAKEETTKSEEKQLMGTLTLKSPSFNHNDSIPSKYTCQGENVNPPLEIKGVHPATKSLVLIMDDPDAPAGTWVHWTVWNIPPDATAIAENSKPEGVEGATSFGETGYGGPCPPSETHRYFFKLYALDATLDLSSTAKKEDLERAMKGHILDKTEFIGLYRKE